MRSNPMVSRVSLLILGSAFTASAAQPQTAAQDRGTDKTPPVVTIRDAEANSPTSIRVRVVTDELATVSVEVSLQCDRPGRVVEGDSLGVFNPVLPGFEHEIVIEGLRPNDEYFSRASAVDLAGNAGAAEGQCVGAITPDRFHYPVETFTAASNPFDLAFRSIEFRPTLVDGEHRYVPSVGEIDALPVDPTGGTILFLEGTQADNDAVVEVAFADGRTFPLYGATGAAMYSSVHIGSNGYITFEAGDTSPMPDLDRFYEFTRVSALWSDLNPWRGGTLSYRQFDDRFVVTWASMPRHLRYDSNTAQIELRFDGVIVLSWLEVAAPDTIVGISPVAMASGTPAGFASTDLSALGAPLDLRPPSSLGSFVRTTPGSATTVSLHADDDGLPYGFLRYSLVTLPGVGTLRDADTGQAILESDLPYSLGDRGQVTFEPPSAEWSGDTSFAFTTSDLWPELGFDSQSSPHDPTPNDGESAPGVVVVQAGEPQLVRSFMIDDTLDTSEWTGLSPGRWEFGQPLGMGYNGVDPTSGYSGNNVLGFNLAGDYPDRMQAESVVSPPIDCSSVTGTRVAFRRWLGLAAGDGAQVSVSTDGVTWTPVYAVATETVRDRQWRYREYDIASIADGQSTVYLRWTMGPSGIATEAFGWNIDDIRVVGFLSPECPGDVTADGAVNARDLFAVLAGVGPVDESDPLDINGDGVIDGQDVFLVIANFGQLCD
jgi:hypothetical protein